MRGNTLAIRQYAEVGIFFTSRTQGILVDFIVKLTTSLHRLLVVCSGLTELILHGAITRPVPPWTEVFTKILYRKLLIIPQFHKFLHRLIAHSSKRDFGV